MPDSIVPAMQSLYVFGTAANDLIMINPSNSCGDVSVSINGTYRGTFHPTNRIIVHGLAGNDYIGVSDRIALSAWLYGDDGNDVLWGGGGPNMLSGGNGNDILYSGKGRNLLIGGTGSDMLAGGLGEALLIGKTTDFDANDLALLAILNEWNSSANYATRVGHITGNSGGLNGSYFFNAITVHNDYNRDTLIGSSAMNMFFQGFGDTVGKKKSWETMISLRR